MPRSISLPLLHAKRLAQAVLPHVSADDVTPSLTWATIHGGVLYGTDRYSVGAYKIISPEKPVREMGSLAARITAESPERYEAKVKDWEERAEVRFGGEGWEEPFYIPRAALKRLATLNEAQTTSGVRNLLDRVRVTITESPESTLYGHQVIIGVQEGSLESFRQVFNRAKSGVFPPVWTLFEKWEPQKTGPVEYGLNANLLGKIAATLPKYEPFKMTAGEPTRNAATGEVIKQAPMMVEVGTDFRILVQPVLLLR